MKGLFAPRNKFIQIDSFNRFTVIGDPGCDGLGAATMSVFAKALNSSQSDFFIVAGDIVPHAAKLVYENAKEFIDRVAARPVYPLCGNHDKDFYDEYFGLRNYALLSPDAAIIILDNSRRSFSAETLAFFREALELHTRPHAIVLFHIPAPNRFTSNSVSQEEWEKLRKVYLPFKENIDCFICGHLHSFFEDSADDIPLVVTGGGGARIEAVHPEIDAKHIGHHVVDFTLSVKDGFMHEFRSLERAVYSKELEDVHLKHLLETAFQGECDAMFKYALHAETAASIGKPWLASLFKALSHSEYYHAKNHFFSLGKAFSMLESLRAGIASESYEIDTMYKDSLDYAKSQGHGLATYSFLDAWMAEKVHLGLLKEAESLLISGECPEKTRNFYTCSSCGYTFHTDGRPTRCPICGAPQDKIMPSQQY